MVWPLVSRDETDSRLGIVHSVFMGGGGGGGGGALF